MIKELDTIVITQDLPEHRLKKGDLGVVVHIYAEKAFEIEFIEGDGKTIAVVTLASTEIRPIANREILHVRDLVAS